MLILVVLVEACRSVIIQAWRRSRRNRPLVDVYANVHIGTDDVALICYRACALSGGQAQAERLRNLLDDYAVGFASEVGFGGQAKVELFRLIVQFVNTYDLRRFLNRDSLPFCSRFRSSYLLEMTAQKYRVGVIGYGLSTTVFQIPYINASQDFELRAIVQRSGDEAAKENPV
jgi:hypothetical protein